MKVAYEQLRQGDFVKVRLGNETLSAVLVNRLSRGWRGIDTKRQDDIRVEHHNFVEATRDNSHLTEVLVEYDDRPLIHLREDCEAVYLAMWQSTSQIDVYVLTELQPGEADRLKSNELDVRDVFRRPYVWKLGLSGLAEASSAVPWPDDEELSLPEAGVKLYWEAAVAAEETANANN